MRTALGAGPLRLVRQLLAETVLLALAGGVAGVALAYRGVQALVAHLPGHLPLATRVDVDAGVLAFTAVLAVVSGLAFGLVPALRIVRPDVREALNEGGRSATDPGSRRLRATLVVAEVALSLVLLVGAGLMLQTTAKLLRLDPGFNPRGMLTARISPPRSDYPEPADLQAFYRRLEGRAAALPGVVSVAAVNRLPLAGGYSCDSFGLRDRPDPSSSIRCAEERTVTTSYFDTMGIRVLRGRDFAGVDADDPAVVVINQAMARQHWPDGDPLGVGFKWGSSRSEGPWRTIVGVVEDVRHFGVDREPAPEVYSPLPQRAGRTMFLTLRTDGDPRELAEPLRRAVLELDPDLPIFQVATMEELVADSVVDRRLLSGLLSLFAAVALALTSVGLYGVLSNSVNRRTGEIGGRMALGARSGDVVRMVVGQGMLLVATGVALGLAAALGLARLLSGLLYDVSARDPLTFAGVTGMVVTIALLATWLPARRATRVDPVRSLRQE